MDSLQHPGVCQSQPSPLSHVAGPANSLCPSWMLNSRDKRTIAPVSLISHARAKTLTYAHPLTVGTLSKLTCSCTRTRTCTPNARARACDHTLADLEMQDTCLAKETSEARRCASSIFRDLAFFSFSLTICTHNAVSLMP